MTTNIRPWSAGYPERVWECTSIELHGQRYKSDEVIIFDDQVYIGGILDPWSNPKDIIKLWSSREPTKEDHDRRREIQDTLWAKRVKRYQEEMNHG